MVLCNVTTRQEAASSDKLLQVEVMTKCKMARLFRQVSQSFGDGGAAQGLEVAILKFEAAAAILLVTKFLLECIRYSNICFTRSKTKRNT